MNKPAAKPRGMLQPALLDRLRDDEPGNLTEPATAHMLSRETLRQFVVRDLEWLFNSTCVLSASQTKESPSLAASVLAYGMPPIAGQLATLIDVRDFESMIASLIRRFEPRIDPRTLQVKADAAQGVLNLHNVIGLRISGLLWACPHPIELALRSEVDLETGRVALMPLSGF